MATMRPALSTLLRVLLLAALLAAPVAGLRWAIGSPAGSAWLLSLVPGLGVERFEGTLLGDWRAAELRIALPGRLPGLVRVRDVAAQGVQWRAAPGHGWVRIEMQRLSASSVEIAPAESDGPATEPTALQLPLQLRVDALRIDRVRVPGIAEPLLDLRASVELGADGGRMHGLDAVSLRWREVQLGGSARIGSIAPLPLQATLRGVHPDWQAEASAQGPLATLALAAQLRGSAAPGRPRPSADATATLRPFAAWPLGDLDARTRALDLAALDASLPATAIDADARVRSQAADRPAELSLALANTRAGRIGEALVPLRRLTLELRARPDRPAALDVQAFDAELGNATTTAGRITGRGSFTPERWTAEALLADVQPALLDARAPKLRIGGPLTLTGTGFDSPGLAAAQLEARADWAGHFDGPGRARDAQLVLDLVLSRIALDLRRAELRAGGARATLAGNLRRDEPGARWRSVGQVTLADFDPQPWWPGRDDSAWRRGPHRLNAKGSFDLALPEAALERPNRARWAALRGEANLAVANSVLAGVPMKGTLALRNDGRAPTLLDIDADAGGNRLRVSGRVDARGNGRSDRWAGTLAAPALAALAPALRLVDAQLANIAGRAEANASVEGRWPELRGEGTLSAQALRAGPLAAESASGRWQISPQPDAPLALLLELTQLSIGERSVETARLDLSGTSLAHTLTLRAQSKALPPAWTDEVLGVPRGGPAATRSIAVLEARGGFVDAPGSPRSGWRGRIGRVERAPDNGRRWLAGEDIGAALRWAGGPASVEVEPGRAEVLGSALRWQRIAWQDGAPMLLEAKAELEPLPIAPLLARLQPDFGWGGDLRVGARLELRSAPSIAADVVIERERGDLTVTEEAGTTALGLTDLRLGLNVANGVWSFTQGLAGSTLGVGAGAVVARTTPERLWPAPDTPITGVLELGVGNLGTWGPWVPAGWRLGGALRIAASIAGTFGAPEYTGEITGSRITVRNFVEGVAVSDGEVAIALQGARATVERITARAGEGSLRLEGVAELGATPQADMRLVADRFQVLGRVDRRIVASGDARLRLDREALALDGRLRVDQGQIDFTRGDAPSLAGDVLVIRTQPTPTDRRAANRPEPTSRRSNLPPARIDVRVDLGERLRLRGRGLETGLRGELHLTNPGGRLALNGTVRADDGTYAAYGEKLEIDRGLVIFSGPLENPRLDIEAIRPDVDIRVGVAITGTAIAPRIRLFSEPDLPEIDKLSWLVLGRASDGLGGTETALLQRAALALLAGDGESFTDQLIRSIGLDAVSVRQTDGEVRETVVSLGKQLSRRWYVGYERNLNDTVGTWQLVYRVARRFTLRAQSGDDNSLDAIWTWRW